MLGFKESRRLKSFSQNVFLKMCCSYLDRSACLDKTQWNVFLGHGAGILHPDDELVLVGTQPEPEHGRKDFLFLLRGQ